MLTPSQLQELNKIIDQKITMFIAKNISTDQLTNEEKKVLRDAGIDVSNIKPKDMLLYQSFALGMISGAVPKGILNELDYEAFKEYLSSGKFIPLNTYEKGVLKSLEKQSLSDIRGVGESYKRALDGALNASERQYYEKVLRDNISDGIARKDSLRNISNDIAKELNSFGRDLDRIVVTVSHQAFTEGRTAFFERNYGEDSECWFQVYEGACKICIAAYTTAGIGSEPKVFKVRELPPPQVNYRKKQADQVVTDSPRHPYCYDDKTEVLTSDGWGLFKDIDIEKDLFLSINLDNPHLVDWVKANKFISYEMKNEWMIRYKSKNIDLLVTQDHRHVYHLDWDTDMLRYGDIRDEKEKPEYIALLYAKLGKNDKIKVKYEWLTDIDLKLKQYTGFVYDVELEKNHTLFVRRNGKVTISGNCRCHKMIKPEGYIWDEEVKDFRPPKDFKRKVERRSKVKIKFGDKNYEI